MPHGITSLPTREIVIVDRGNHRIHVLTPDERFSFTCDSIVSRTYGKIGSKRGEFIYPHGVTTLLSGEIAITDDWNHRIQIVRVSMGNLHDEV